MGEGDGQFLETFSDEEKGFLAGQRWAVCVGRFYEDLALRLLAGADEGFEQLGVPTSSVDRTSVPGAYELPFAAKLFAETGNYAGVVCLGVVIRGETDHFDFVCAESARGIQDVQLQTGVPCAFGVITCDNMDQALARSGGGKRDQGRNGALTVARMALLKRQLS
ncbi:MAG TPA: 6,7-dimethyl-8-ribityllumazine synthase [Solirubrobacterales bacterium]|nr:6,7-dimethyl-8-ribityllumazine synthase [Solirubrobacterales bacterium]